MILEKLHFTFVTMNTSSNSHSAAAFYTGVADYAPLLPFPAIGGPSHLDAIRFPRVQKTALWLNNTNIQSPPTNKMYDVGSPSPILSQTSSTKGIKRHLDLEGGPSKSEKAQLTTSSIIGKKRQSGRISPQEGTSNGTNQPPPNKRALLNDPGSVSPSTGTNRGTEWDNLSEEIWNKYVECQQTEEVFTKKMRLRDVLYRSLQDKFTYCGLYVVGSSMNGFGCDTSDMDMCLMLTTSEIDQKSEAIGILREIQRILCLTEYIEKVELIRAIVPILKFTDSVSCVEVDLNVNNSVGIRNTHLLRCYSRLDWRVRPLVLIVKLWAKEQDINDAKCMTVSSYSLVLMVINYLQCGVSPPVLPCLHKLCPQTFVPYSDVRSLPLDCDLPPYKSNNTMSLGQLLVDFLNYYTNKFDFRCEAISVRLGCKLPKYTVQSQKSRKNTPGQWKCLCIEEPFDLTNTARSVYDEEVFKRVKQVFHTSWRRIMDTKHMGSILPG